MSTLHSTTSAPAAVNCFHARAPIPSRAVQGARRRGPAQPLLTTCSAGNGSDAVATKRQPGGRQPKWEVMWQKLYGNEKLQVCSAAEAKQMLDEGGWLLVDVRPKHRYEESHPVGAVNVPLYERTNFSKFNAASWLKAIFLKSQGVDPVDFNENFVDEVAAAAGNKKPILMCEIGGSLTPTVSFATGKVSRSLMASYNAVSSGLFQNGVGHVKGGCYGWFRAGLPMEGNYNASEIGRTPSVVEEETFSYGRPTEGLKIDP